MPGLDLPPTHSYSRPEDTGPHESCLQAAMDRLEVLLTDGLPQDLSETLSGKGSRTACETCSFPGQLSPNY